MAAEPGVLMVSPSRLLAAWLMGASSGAMVLLLLYLPPIAAVPAACFVFLRCWHDLRLHALLRHPRAVVAVQCGNGAGPLRYRLRCGEWHEGVVLAGGLVARRLIVVRLRNSSGDERCRALVLCADSLQPGDHRRLRVHLHWQWRDPDQALSIKA